MALSLDTLNKLSVENGSWMTLNKLLDSATPHVTFLGSRMVTNDVSWHELYNKVCSLFKEHQERIEENQGQKESWTLQDRIAGFATIEKVQQLQSQIDEAAKVANFFTRFLMCLRNMWFAPSTSAQNPRFDLFRKDSYEELLCLYPREDFSRQFHFYFKNPDLDEGCVGVVVSEQTLRDPSWQRPDHNIITLIDGSRVSRKVFEGIYYKLKGMFESGLLVKQFDQEIACIEQEIEREEKESLTLKYSSLLLQEYKGAEGPLVYRPSDALNYQELEGKPPVYRPWKKEREERRGVPCELVRWLQDSPPLEIRSICLDEALIRLIIGNCFSNRKGLNFVEYAPPKLS